MCPKPNIALTNSQTLQQQEAQQKSEEIAQAAQAQVDEFDRFAEQKKAELEALGRELAEKNK